MTYNNNSELYAYFMGLQFIVEYAGKEVSNQVNFDETKHPSLQTTDLFSAATLDWNDSTRELVITYPETIELYGKQESVNISQIYSNGCNFGNAITKLESYGEVKQALKPYVKETRAALSGKQDTLVSGTNIKTINGETLLGEGNITIEGGGSSINVVQTTGASTADVMSQDAVTKALKNTNLVSTSYSSGLLNLECKDPFNTRYRTMLKFGTINGMTVANIGSERPSFSLVEASAITTSVTSESTDTQVPSAKAVYDALQEGGGGSSYTAGDGIDINNDVISVTGKVDTSSITTSISSSSTDSQVPSAKAVNDKLGGLSLVKLTQSEYSAMEQAGTLDNSTLYVVINS